MADRLMDKLRKKEDQKLLDDFVPGHWPYPTKIFEKLVEPEYTKAKLEHENEQRIADMKTHDRVKNERLEQLRKLAIEVDRANLINQQVQKLKMKLIYGNTDGDHGLIKSLD